jgi:triosephosphate isomerase
VTGVCWVGTSWKMNKTLAEARAYVDELSAHELPAGVQPFLLPPHTALAAVRDALPAGSPILLGAQNAHWAPEGEATGEISMRMAADAGATLIEMGHSERRAQFGETDETVARKAAAAVAYGLIPLICVGEPDPVRQDGRAEAYVEGQLVAALSRLSPAEVGTVIVAYEPVWAIGTAGRPATPDQIAPVLARIAEVLNRSSTSGSARALLYGGSVSTDNAEAILAVPHVDGLFVGRAAWTAAGFRDLLRLAGDRLRQGDEQGGRPPWTPARLRRE